MTTRRRVMKGIVLMAEVDGKGTHQKSDARTSGDMPSVFLRL